MCGIVGIAMRNRRINSDLLIKMRDRLVHRGPDFGGTWVSSDHRVGLAHRRLAIIDLSEEANQPMEDISKHYAITFNGEIYNFQDIRKILEKAGYNFQTLSDTEVLLKGFIEWGADCLKFFKGAFSFAIYDEREKRLFLARDRGGEKPLFWRATPAGFHFASELKALFADQELNRKLDLIAFDHYLAYGYSPREKTIIEGVQKLPPGHALIFELETGKTKMWQYWSLPESNPTREESDLVEELRNLLETSIRRQMVSDVPLGILLSGGLDSSLITAIASKISSTRINTFTVTFPGEKKYDEGPYARQIADYFGTNHIELPANDMPGVEILPRIAQQFDEPIADHSIIPTALISSLIKKHATVAIGGDGGDELFGGYPHYNFLNNLGKYRELLPSFLRFWTSRISASFLPLGFAGRNHLIGLSGNFQNSIAHINLYFDCLSRKRLVKPLLVHKPFFSNDAEKLRTKIIPRNGSILQKATRTDFISTMSEGYLVKVDRASMLHSLEVRAPFLDTDLIEFAFGTVPDSFRATQTERKILLRLLGEKILPKGYDFKRKQGFSLPLQNWIKKEWGTFFKDVLSQASPELFCQREIRKLFSLQERGYNNSNRLFSLVVFELWRREYKISLPNSF